MNVLSVKHNAMKINSIMDFCRIKGNLCGGLKNVCFVRIVGFYENILRDISEMDSLLSDGTIVSDYYRLSALPKIVSDDDIRFYSEKYNAFLSNNKIETRKTAGNSMFEDTLGNGIKTVLAVFSKVKSQVSETICKNFSIKLMLWIDYLFDKLSVDWNDRVTVKIAACNISGIQEYLFYYLLTLIGFDVLLMQCECDIDCLLDKEGFSDVVIVGEKRHISVPEYIKPKKAETPIKSASQPAANVVVKIPERQRNTAAAPVQTKEKTLEELAKLASSVVMIGIHNESGKVVGSGSGIMIGRDGYILTNNHVANGGRFYSVKIEDDDNIYETDEVIKYNSLQDLAIIRIDRTLSPIPVYKGETKLVRGQKVVAIGSPLGLFNTVSDGIISGFRVIKSVDMIQFTAPISHGSSGGALLNMNGELIGISTAGIDEGQNINLAMGYECINLFIKGFI